MALPSFPPDDPATLEGELLLGPPESDLRAQVRKAAVAAQRGESAISASAARQRLAKVPGVAEELAALDSLSPADLDL